MRSSMITMCCAGLLTLASAGCDGDDPAAGGDATTATGTDATAEDATSATETTPLDTSLPDISSNENKELRNGTTARIGHITDGDTLDVWVGTLAPKKYIIRMLGLAAPECDKGFVQGPFGGGNACTADDELYGLKSYQALVAMLEGKTVRVTCDVSGNDWCKQDDFDRYLAYLEVDGKDAATEMARGGNGFSYVEFASSKRAAICAAEYEARDAKRGIWALGTVDYIMARMHEYTSDWYLQHHDDRCDAALGL